MNTHINLQVNDTVLHSSSTQSFILQHTTQRQSTQINTGNRELFYFKNERS